jgi:3-mercaptopropionate dioxygenase
MTTTQTRPVIELRELLDGIRTAVAARASWSDTARLVAEQLRQHLPGPDVLSDEQRLGSPDGYRSHTLHVEPEELFDPELNLIGRSDNHIGDVSGFAPPGDIHRVHNTARTTAISIHIYGTDVTRTGSSVRRYYD